MLSGKKCKSLLLAWVLLLCWMNRLSAQSDLSIIQAYEKALNDSVKKGGYIPALFYVKKINTLLMEDMGKVIWGIFPAKVGNYEIDTVNKPDITIGAFAGEVTFSKKYWTQGKNPYRKIDPDSAKHISDDPADTEVKIERYINDPLQISTFVQISVDNSYMTIQGITMMHSSQPGSQVQESADSKAVRVKGYRSVWKRTNGFKELDILIGACALIIKGSGSEPFEFYQKAADGIDFNKLKGLFGE